MQEHIHICIGVSKKLCFLCDRILQNYRPLVEHGAQSATFKARQCHEKVYPLWTLPRCEDMHSTRKQSLAKAVADAHREMRQMLQQKQKLQLQPATVESTAAVTSEGSLPAELLPLVDDYMTHERSAWASKGAKRSSRIGWTWMQSKNSQRWSLAERRNQTENCPDLFLYHIRRRRPQRKGARTKSDSGFSGCLGCTSTRSPILNDRGQTSGRRGSQRRLSTLLEREPSAARQ